MRWTSSRATWRGVLRISALALASAASWATAAPPPERFALTNCRIIPIDGKEIAKGVVLIERGKIAAIGEGGKVEIPFDAREFDCTDKVIMPGAVVAYSSEGQRNLNESRPIVPQLDVGDVLDPSSTEFEDCLRRGITGVHMGPSLNTSIGGVGRLVRPIGRTVADMTVLPPAFEIISVSGRFGLSRMTQRAEMRAAFAELKAYMSRLCETKYEEKLAEDEKEIDVAPAEARKRGRELVTADDLDDEHLNLLRLVGGQVDVEGEKTPKIVEPLGAMIYCARAQDVAPAIQLAKDNGFFERSILVLGDDCYKAIDELKKAARPVVLAGDLLYRETNPLTGEETEVFVPAKIAAAGLQFALLPGPSSSMAERMPTYQAARCVREGVARDVALKAITLEPAKMLGVGDQFGSLAAGKVANLAVWSGDPLAFDSVVELVFVDGIPAYERTKDVRLQRLMSDSQGDPAGREGRRD